MYLSLLGLIMVSPYDDPIEIVPSRHKEWRRQFEAERDRVAEALSSAGLADAVHRIDHVGSTAVPDLAAKDIVDIDIVVDDDAVVEVARTIETVLGGSHFENTPLWNPVFREANGQRFNDHVFGLSADGWKVSVATVAVLGEHPDRRTEYEQLKREKASTTDELEGYSQAKTACIERLLETAQETDLGLGFDVPDSR
jgi:GrpB-like predicted nucleotidyltransferase (UPF0157 family)